jgi:hypothetical protein
MFTIPSLRARKPGRVEKKALDIAFLVTPIVSLGMPFLTQVRVQPPCEAGGHEMAQSDSKHRA